jgi:hypothetical protein
MGFSGSQVVMMLMDRWPRGTIALCSGSFDFIAHFKTGSDSIDLSAAEINGV